MSLRAAGVALFAVVAALACGRGDNALETPLNHTTANLPPIDSG